MMKRVVISIFLLTLVMTAYWIYLNKPTWSDYFNRDPVKIKLNTYMKMTDQFIREDRLDSAGKYLDQMVTGEYDSLTNSRLIDSARALQWQIKQIGLLDTGNIYIGVLMQLNDQEYDDFLNSRLTKKYLGHPGLNRLFLQKLHYRSQPWDQTIHETDNLSSRTIQSNSKSPAQVRRLFAESIKSSFINLGFDISVEITGRDSTTLILTAPEFDDVWFEKFESDSDMTEWHHSGFTQVEIRNDSGYVKVKTW